MIRIITITVAIFFFSISTTCTKIKLGGDVGEVDERQDSGEAVEDSRIDGDSGTEGECVLGVEVCDGLDNDCDPLTPDGSGDLRDQTECRPLDPNACGGYTWQCKEGEWVCEQLHGPATVAVDLTYDMDEDDALNADIAWDGAAFVAGYVAVQLPQTTRIYALRIDADGNRLSEPVMLDSSNDYFELSMGAGSGESLAVWYATPEIEDWFLRYARLNTEGQIVASGVMPNHYMFIKKPEVARGTHGWLVVYAGRSSADAAIPVYSLHLDEDGIPSGSPLQIGFSDTAGMGDHRDLGITPTDTGYAVVWRVYPGGGVNALLLSEDGLPQGSAVEITPRGSFAPSIAFDGTNFGVLWHEESGVYFRTFQEDGSLGCGPLEVSARTSFQVDPSIVNVVGRFTVYWQGAEGVEANDGLYKAIIDEGACLACLFSNIYCAQTDPFSIDYAMARMAVSGLEPNVGLVFVAISHIWYIDDLATSCE